MKLKINPYVIGLLRDNILYIVLNIFVCVLIIFIVFINSKKAIENTKKITTLNTEIQDLERRTSLFNNALLGEVDLDATIKGLNELIPNSEDYFSVIYALEKLSQKTGFIINSYYINMALSTSNKLKLLITGTGDRTSFLKFLSEYNFGGGRLITSDKIELTPQISGQIKVDITFYSKKTDLSQNSEGTKLSPTFLEDLARLKQKVQFDLKVSSVEGDLNLNYLRKTNPF